MVSTHLKNIIQIGSFPQVGVNIKTLWNHQLDSNSSQVSVTIRPRQSASKGKRESHINLPMEISGCRVCFILQSKMKILRHLQVDHQLVEQIMCLNHHKYMFRNLCLDFHGFSHAMFATVSAVLKRKNICSITQFQKTKTQKLHKNCPTPSSWWFHQPL